MHNERELQRAKRQLELHIWKTVIASRHHANKMKELQKLADEMMVSFLVCFCGGSGLSGHVL